MHRLLILVLFISVCAGCGKITPSTPEPAADASASTYLDPLVPGVWVHSTFREVEGYGRVPSNGLVVASAGEALLIDTGWSDDPEAATASILAEVRQRTSMPVRRVILTHFHDDSVAGIGALRGAGVPSYATQLTSGLIDDEGWGRPDSLLDGGAAEIWTLGYGDRAVEVFYAGPGHTADNVVVFVPEAGVLYGGCLVRPGESESLGNTADADLERWAATVARVRDRYADRLQTVVPSHGSPGGPELLDHTIRLVQEHGASGPTPDAAP